MDHWRTIHFQLSRTITLTTLFIYFDVISFTRNYGKCSFSKINNFDFIVSVAVGSVIATTILSNKVSPVQGLVGLFMLFLFQIIIAMLSRFKLFRKTIDTTTLLLMYESSLFKNNSRRARVTKVNLCSKLRKVSMLNLSEV